MAQDKRCAPKTRGSGKSPFFPLLLWHVQLHVHMICNIIYCMWACEVVNMSECPCLEGFRSEDNMHPYTSADCSPESIFNLSSYNNDDACAPVKYVRSIYCKCCAQPTEQETAHRSTTLCSSFPPPCSPNLEDLRTWQVTSFN